MAQQDRINGLVGTLGIKAPVRVATTANITLSGEQTIDGVAAVAGDRVLVKDQTTGSENGIYAVATTAWAREPDFDGSRDAITGSMVRVVAGTSHAGTMWELTTTGAITIGTTSLTFAKSFGAIAVDTHAATSKATPVDADELPLADSAASFALKKLTWANLKATLGTTFAALNGNASQPFSTAALTASGVVTVTAGSAAAPAITTTGDTNTGILFPAADSVACSVAGAEMWRTTANGFGVGMTPAGLTGTRLYINNATNAAAIELYPSNTRTGYMYCATGTLQIGTITATPVEIIPNNVTTFKFDSSSNSTHVSPTGLLGYGTGAGGTVTQGTSRTTGVTINKPCGDITLVSAAATAWEGASGPLAFTVTNSLVAATDTIIVDQKSGTDKYLAHVTAKGAGSFEISYGTTGGTTTEQPVLHFSILKSVTA